MNCKDCIHYEACLYHITEETEMTVYECTNFKDKSKFIELPCKVGDNIYYTECVFDKEIRQLEVKIKRTTISSIEIDKYNKLYHCQNEKLFLGENVGRDIFLSKEEAEKALKERESE